ncbi:pinin [Bombyx mori]|uniref:Pinin/SDK/MemA protein domain-containing protein n=1 Tax=Bombyx mori TaxID=7091 RepID=A0A8R2ALQ7_BOMMO|nr:pinin [Bombyx mori]
MGTEVAISFSSLRAQLENEKSNLFKLDENIKKIVQTTGRFANDRFNSGDYPRGGNRIGNRNSFTESGNNFKPDEQFGKRKQETKTVFSRISARADNSDGEDDLPTNKRVRVSSAVCRELPTRAAILKAQGDDEQARTRNRRIFGSLLGTLQKFKQEEIELQTKEDKKAQVERKIEEQARLQKEKEFRERKVMFAEREQKKATIKALEAKMGRVQEFEIWETTQKNLRNFILTKAKPHVYWMPKKLNDKAKEKLDLSQMYHDKCVIKKREELQDELSRIEQRCTKRFHQQGPEQNGQQVKEEKPDKKTRDKFAADTERDDSDADGPDEDTHEDTTMTHSNQEETIKQENTPEIVEPQDRNIKDDEGKIIEKPSEVNDNPKNDEVSTETTEEVINQS